MSQVTPRPIKPDANYVEDPEGRRIWLAGQLHCWFCGIHRERLKFGRPSRWPLILVTHHIIRPGRSDELCNYAAGCNLCHSLCHGARVKWAGEYLPELSLGAQLAIKRECDPGNFDVERLKVLYGQELPDLKVPPIWFFEERARNAA